MTQELIQELENLLARKRMLVDQRGAGPADLSRRRELRTWQAQRLARTYSDLRDEPRFGHAIDFFLDDLYGPRDVTRRDAELMRAWRYLKRTLPEAALRVLLEATKLELLTLELDEQMVCALPSGPLTAESYAAAYRVVGRRESRVRQIDLVIGIGEQLDRMRQHEWIGVALRVAHRPAHAAGFGVLQDFLERGFDAFRRMNGADAFLRTIRDREMRLMDDLLAGRGDPLRAIAREASASDA
jgi:hypothetical protein